LISQAQAILIQASSKDGSFNYNTFGVVVIIEVFKAVFSACLHFYSLWQNSSLNSELFETFFESFKSTYKIGVNMIIPSFIYALYNNILFYNVGHFGPGVYKVLMNSRIIMIALLSIFILKKNLDFQKWVSCFLLYEFKC
jgi:drug/metabolite transporter (DMT)-like permease